MSNKPVAETISAQPAELPTQAEQPSRPKTFTNWQAFSQAHLVPAELRCQAYKPVHLGDMSCHTGIQAKAAILKRHIEQDHGAGFMIVVKDTDGKPSSFWKELEDLGLEAHDFRCDVCDQELRFAPTSILRHMKSHSGKTRRARPGGHFNFTLGLSQPEPRDDDEGEFAVAD